METLRSNTYPASYADHDLLARSVLDGLSARVAVIDVSGSIVFVNGAWKGFAVASGADPDKACGGPTTSGPATRRAGRTSRGPLSSRRGGGGGPRAGVL